MLLHFWGWMGLAWARWSIHPLDAAWCRFCQAMACSYNKRTCFSILMPKKGHLVVWLSDRGRIDIWLQMIWSGSLKRFVEHPSPIQLCGLCHMPKFVNWTQMPFHASFEPSEHFPDCCWPCRICLMAHKNLTDELTWKLPHYMVQYEKKCTWWAHHHGKCLIKTH